jgi:hypothetical protein
MRVLGARTAGRAVPIFLCLALLVIAAPAAALAAAPFTRAFTDDVWFTGSSQGNANWVARTSATGAKLVLLEVDWSSVAPTAPPAGANLASPAAPNYDFSGLDGRIKEFSGSGVAVALLVTDAPSWAEGPGGSADLRARGAWEPNPTAFGEFATALARRYSGTYPDPMRPGRTLPRVRYFQAWAEANFIVHLAPQWQQQGGKLVATGPLIYRKMLNAFYSGVKSVQPSDFVVTTGFGPYGDPPGVCPPSEAGNGCRIPPAEFARDLLCLSGHSLQPQSCPDPAHFDALAMDPYEVGAPSLPAYNADDVTAPDLWKLTRVLNKAVSVGTAMPRAHKQLWVTEFSYDSRPPNPTGVSLATQAHWLEQAFYIFWKQGVSTAVWYLVSDQTGTNYKAEYYSGVYFANGARKPSFEAFRFPFVVSGSTVWGISPRSGPVLIQRQQGRRWTTLLRLHASAGGVFVHSISARLTGNFRAVADLETSLVWHR